MGAQKLSLALPPPHRAACHCTQLHGASHPARDPGPKSPAAIPWLFQLLTLGRFCNFSFTPALIDWRRAVPPVLLPAPLSSFCWAPAVPTPEWWFGEGAGVLGRAWGARDSQEHLISLGNQAERAPHVPSSLEWQEVSMGRRRQLLAVEGCMGPGAAALTHSLYRRSAGLWCQGDTEGLQGQKLLANVSGMRGPCWAWGLGDSS